MPSDVMLRAVRCSKCGALSRRVYTLGSRYVCDKDACLADAIREAGARLGVAAEELEESLPLAMARIRANFDSSY